MPSTITSVSTRIRSYKEVLSKNFQQAQPDISQRHAITCTDPAILIVAGPGTGKTRVLSARLAYLLESGACSPNEILVISFTNSAAYNLRKRANYILRGSVATVAGIVTDTFHGFCASVIRRHIHLVMPSYSERELTIANEADQMRIMKRLMDAKGYSTSSRDILEVLNQIRRWKESGLGYVGVNPDDLHSLTAKRAYDIYFDYQQQLRVLSALDFGDLLLFTIRLFRKHDEVLNLYRTKYKHILIDEFQDISPAQYDILRLLVMGSKVQPINGTSISNSANGPDFIGGTNFFDTFIPPLIATSANDKANKSSIPPKINIFCAGDDDQSIYAWRGSQVEIMRRFRYDFPGARVMRFEKSYRLSDTMNKVANTIVSSIPDRIVKTLEGGGAARSYDGSVVDPSVRKGGAIHSQRRAVGRPVPGRIYADPGDVVTVTSEPDIGPLGAESEVVLEIKGLQDEESELEWLIQYLQSKLSTQSERTRGSGIGVHVGVGGDRLASTSPGVDDYSVAVLTRYQGDLRRVVDALIAAKVPFSTRG